MGLASWFSNLLGAGAAVLPVQESVPGMEYDDVDANLSGNQNAANWRRLTQSSADLTPLTRRF